MYELDCKPYYVKGPESAQVDMVTAIPLLCHYCNSLPSDMYTVYAPDWYIERADDNVNCRVVILMPLLCPITEPIVVSVLVLYRTIIVVF